MSGYILIDIDNDPAYKYRAFNMDFGPLNLA